MFPRIARQLVLAVERLFVATVLDGKAHRVGIAVVGGEEHVVLGVVAKVENTLPLRGRSAPIHP